MNFLGKESTELFFELRVRRKLFELRELDFCDLNLTTEIFQKLRQVREESNIIVSDNGIVQYAK